MKYKILEAYIKVNLEQAVEKYMREGWKPQGGICVSRADSANLYSLYSQALIKEEEEGIHEKINMPSCQKECEQFYLHNSLSYLYDLSLRVYKLES